MTAQKVDALAAIFVLKLQAFMPLLFHGYYQHHIVIVYLHQPKNELVDVQSATICSIARTTLGLCRAEVFVLPNYVEKLAVV